MRRFVLLTLITLGTLGVVVVPNLPDEFSLGVALAGACTSQTPMGAVSPSRPIWCEALAPGRDTHTEGTNSWVDGFDHGQTFADLNPRYVEGFFGNGDALHFQHNNHWMVDIESHGSGALIGAWMRPNRTFRLQSDGTLVVEFEVATPIADTRENGSLSDSWPELVISTAPAPPGIQEWGSALRRNGTYLYEAFPGYWTFGCRMQQSKHPICALYMDDYGTAGTKPSRRWEINQNGGEVSFERGGGPGGLAPDAWKGCNTTQDPDVVCRNKFRWEIRADEVKLYSNGTLFYHAGLINTEMNNILRAQNGFYVFFGDFAYRFEPGRALRFHWDRVAINPAGGTTPPPPTATPTRTPIATPTRTPVPTPGTTPAPTIGPATGTVTFDDKAGQNQALNGQYPANAIDWGSNNWYHSGPYERLTTKSVSFNGGGSTSKSFRLVTPRKLVRLQAYNGGDTTTTVTLACAGQPTRTTAISAGQLVTITTNWTGTCSTVTVSSSNGWDTNFDNIVLQ
jgi:hypothetical protein